jgi:hypothetical protein
MIDLGPFMEAYPIMLGAAGVAVCLGYLFKVIFGSDK